MSSIENGCVISNSGDVIYWHSPPWRNFASLPESRDLWEVLWTHRDELWGFAHSHPGNGNAYPSWTDITTFDGVELALGKRLKWPILTKNGACLVTYRGPGKYDYMVEQLDDQEVKDLNWSSWVENLRTLSYNFPLDAEKKEEV